MFRLTHNEEQPAPIVLNNHALPWVEHAAHLGHELHTTGKQDLDCNMRRGAYIGETIELLNLFQFAHPMQKLAAVQTYACSFYGSNLVDLYGPAACQLYRAWQVTVRDAWGVPRQTHNYIVDNLLSGHFPHIRQLIIRRFFKFVNGLITSKNPVISALSYWGVHTRLSTTGNNVANIWKEFKMNPLQCSPVNFSIPKREVPENGHEIMDLLKRLFETRSSETEPEIVSELEELIDNVCMQ